MVCLLKDAKRQAGLLDGVGRHDARAAGVGDNGDALPSRQGLASQRHAKIEKLDPENRRG